MLNRLTNGQACHYKHTCFVYRVQDSIYITILWESYSSVLISSYLLTVDADFIHSYLAIDEIFFRKYRLDIHVYFLFGKMSRDMTKPTT